MSGPAIRSSKLIYQDDTIRLIFVEFENPGRRDPRTEIRIERASKDSLGGVAWTHGGLFNEISDTYRVVMGMHKHLTQVAELEATAKRFAEACRGEAPVVRGVVGFVEQVFAGAAVETLGEELKDAAQRAFPAVATGKEG